MNDAPPPGGHPGAGSAPNQGHMGDVREFSDARLVLAIARFHPEALAEVYRRHGGAVYALARRVTGDPGEAEDVAQEVLLRLWNDPDRYDPERGALRSFLLTQAHGRAVDAVRTREARRRREEQDVRRTVTQGYDPENEMRGLVLADQVSRAMESLNEDERRAIELAYFDGLTYREVATRLSQPEGTVKSRIRSGLRRLRTHLTDVAVQGS